MKLAQEVRERRMQKMREVGDSRTENEIVQVFCFILNLLDEATKKNDFDGVSIFAGERVGKRYTVEIYGFCDWKHPSGELKVEFAEPVYPCDFLINLRNYINAEEGYIAEFRRFASNIFELHVNIK